MEKELQLTDLVDIGILQKIQDAFSSQTGIAALITDINGNDITEVSNYTDFCFKYTRSSEKGCIRCAQCDKFGAEMTLKKGRSVTYYCHAGLIDFAAPIRAKKRILGYFIGGQVLTEPPNEPKIRRIAEELGVDPDEYLEAAWRVKRISQEDVEKSAEFLYAIAGILSDIAYSRLQLRKANLEIEKAANMKSDFLANMSHEIRTPMNAVIGMAEMALREPMPDSARYYINEIKSSGKSLLTIINDILDFSKIESGKMDILPTEYKLIPVIQEVITIVTTQLKDKDIELLLDINPDVPSVLFGDTDRIKQVILNIVNNAIKFTKKGKVAVHLDFARTSEEEVLLQFAVEDTGIGIKKADLMKLFQSFQQVDSKRNRNIEGTGLGLAICQRLLKLMNGTISVQSEYEKGSIFTFQFPQKILDDRSSIVLDMDQKIKVASLLENPYVKEQFCETVLRLGAEYLEVTESEVESLVEEEVTHLFVEEPHLTKEVQEFAKNHSQITVVLLIDPRERVIPQYSNILVVKKPIYVTNLVMIFKNEGKSIDIDNQSQNSFDFVAPEAEILIVDDNEVNLTVAEGLLEPLNMHIDTATSGKEAVEKISEKMYDLIFMDHMMPSIDGVETTRIIRRFHKEYDDVPIIALTANAVGGTKEMFLQEGMNDFVAKPVDVKVLVSKVKCWLPPEKIIKQQKHESAQSESSERNIPVIGDLDVEGAIAMLGSERVYWKVLKDYYRVIESKIQTILRHVSEEDWQAYTIEVHALKSASRQIGAKDLANKAEQLEKAGNEGNIVLIRTKTEDMLLKYEHYISILKPFFGHEKQKEAIKPAATAEMLHASLTSLKAAMENLEFDEMEEILEQMKVYDYEKEQTELFEKLQEAVENMDPDTCEVLLSTWEERLSSFIKKQKSP